MPSRMTTPRISAGPVLGVALVIAAVIAWFWIDPLAFNRAYRLIELFWLPATVLLVLGILGVIAAAVLDKSWPMITGLAAGVLGAVAVMMLRSWSASVVYAEIPEEADTQPSFEERVPYSVADRSAQSALEGVNADLGRTVYLTGTNSYATPATARGFMGFTGYEAVVEQNFELDGTFDGTQQCGFSDDAQKRMGGWFVSSLERAIAAESRTIYMDRADAWAFCDEDTAMIAVPVDKRAGNPFNRHFVPAGVALYDGSTGEVEILHEVTEDQLPGPVVSENYAALIEEAMSHRDNEGVLSVLLRQTGYQTPDASSINHQLGDANGGSAHVTALQRVSASTAVEYILAVPSGEVTAGEHPGTEMYLLDPTRRDNTVISDSIRSQFSDINWDSGIEVQEITPGPEGTWVASIGQATEVVYRVKMDGNESSTWTITDMRTGREEEVDESDLSEEADSADAGADSAPIEFNGEDVSEMTDAQLRELVRTAIDEMDERDQ